MKVSDIPNLISFLRILLTLPIVWLLFEHEFTYALMLFALAGFSDGLDGSLAKRFSFLVLGGLGLIPIWLVIIVISRDLLIVGGALYYNFNIEELDANPSMISKLNTLMQILLVLLVVTDAGPYPMPGMAMSLLVWATLATTVASGAGYVWVWSSKAKKKGRRD